MAYIRKTRDYWSIVSQYGEECKELTYEDAKRTKKDYIDNGYYVRIVKHRERI